LQSFTDDNQTFGAVRCFPCRVTDAVEGVVVIPARSNYDDVMEIVAGVCLRDLLGLKDGDKITVEILRER
jgi:riboflavin kinase